MKALVYCYGTRGDVQPYLAIAYALGQAGHEATLAAPAMFADMAKAYGVRFAPLSDDGVELHTRPDVHKVLTNSDRPEEEYRKIRQKIVEEVMPGLYPRILRQYWEAAADGTDIIVYSPTSRQAIHQIAEKLGVPHVLATLYPHFVPSERYGNEVRTLAPQPGNLERHSKERRNPLPKLYADMIMEWRRDVLGLPPREDVFDHRVGPDGNPTPVLHGFSPNFVEVASDWPEWVHTTGFWQVPRLSEWEPPKRLTRFLQDGEKPVVIGFSSHVGVNPEANGEIVLEAVRELGIRAIVVAGWGGIAIKDPPQNMLIETEIPYDWLFPRVRAVVHTGGCGTHNAALVAGVPHATVPVHREGLMWSNHLHDLGLAPEPIMMRDLTAGKLAAAIREAVENRQYAVNAAALGEKIAAENGARGAATVLERVHRDVSGSARTPA